jgi:hypothetical protein
MRLKMGRRTLAAAAALCAAASFNVLGAPAALATPTATTALATPTATTTAVSARVCGSMAGARPHITKVLWIFMENTSYGTGAKQIPGDPSAAYIDGTLLAQCGSSSDYHGVSHPSYPNYLAATSGSTHESVSDHLGFFTSKSIFSQVDPSWRSYEQYMPVGCDHIAMTGSAATGYYVGRHNPADSYSSLPVGAPTAGDCPRFDGRLGSVSSGRLHHAVRTGTLPRFSFVTPGLCNDMHTFPLGVAGCSNPIKTGDSWLAKWIPVITSGPDYTSGHLMIDVAWDEGSKGTDGANCVTSAASNCIVPNIVISPYTTHKVSSKDFSHYSLLRTTEYLLGLKFLRHAADTTTKNMCGTFGLCH